MQERPNYYILLELEFSPAVSDKKEIEKAIAKKQQQWSKEMNNPIKKVKASQNLALIADIKNVMFSKSLREAEAQDAIYIKESKARELDDKLLLYASKSDELSEKDLKFILKKFASYGFDESTIKSKFNIIIKEQNKKIDLKQTIDKNQAKNIKNFMGQLGNKSQTLYEFLNLSQENTCANLLNAAEHIKQKILAKGTKTGEDNAKQSLCGICAVVFKDKESKNKYDNYLNLTKYTIVNDAIDEIAASNKRVIEPKMKVRLIDIAVETYRISPSQAAAYISNYCELLGYQEREKSIICGLCNTENPASATTCLKCGKNLIITCPVCEFDNSNSATNCAKCGFDLSKMQNAIGLINEAKALWIDKNIIDAEKKLNQAEIFWPNHDQINKLKEQIREYKTKLESIEQKIDVNLRENKYYYAWDLITSSKINDIIIDEATSNKVKNKINYVEEKLNEIRKMPEEEAYASLAKLSEEITDSANLKTMLEKYPPKAPSEISFKVEQESVILNWSASSSYGDISYKLVRKENSPPNNLEDGKVIYEGKELSFSDESLSKSKIYYYAIFAIRAKLCSKAKHLDEKVVVVENVKNIKAIGGDGFINITWDKPETISEVKIWQYMGNEKPNSIDECERINCDRIDGTTVSNLINNKRYWFYICAGHNINGEEYYSNMQLVYTVACKTAQPLKITDVYQENNVFRIKFSKPEWEVVFFTSDIKPDYVENTVYSLEDILKELKSEDFNFKSLNEVEMILNFVGKKYIIPAQINATNVVLNKPIAVTFVPEAKNISYDFNSAKTELFVNFDWPEGIEKVFLAYRNDKFPEDEKDQFAKKEEYTKNQYIQNDGISILSAKENNYYISIFTLYKDEDTLVYSKPVNIKATKNTKIDVRYSFKYKYSKFSKVSSLSVHINSNIVFSLPKFCIVSKFKSLPLNRADGEIIYKSQSEITIKQNYTFELNVKKLQKGTKIKLFFVDDMEYNHYKLLNEGNSEV